MAANNVNKTLSPTLELTNIYCSSPIRVASVNQISAILEDWSLLFISSYLHKGSPALKLKRTKTIETPRKQVHAVPEDVGSTTTPVVNKEQDVLNVGPVDTDHCGSETQKTYVLLKYNIKCIVSVYTTSFKDSMETNGDATGEDVSKGVYLVLTVLDHVDTAF